MNALADINASYLIDANVTGGGSASSSSVPLRRVSFVYSHDLIGGWAWSLNSHGIGQSVNALDPTNLTIGVADAFHARYVAGATSLSDAVQRACALKPLAGGQHFNLGSIHEPDHQLMIEASNVGCDVRVLRKLQLNFYNKRVNRTNLSVISSRQNSRRKRANQRLNCRGGKRGNFTTQKKENRSWCILLVRKGVQKARNPLVSTVSNKLLVK